MISSIGKTCAKISVEINGYTDLLVYLCYIRETRFLTESSKQKPFFEVSVGAFCGSQAELSLRRGILFKRGIHAGIFTECNG